MLRSQRCEQPQREEAVLVGEVGAQTQQVSGLGQLAREFRRASWLPASTMVQSRGDDPDALVLDERIGEQLTAGVVGEDHDALGRREAVATGTTVGLPSIL